MRVQDPLLVVEVEHRDSARGGFTTLTLGNRHGRLSTAPFWPEDQPRIAGIERGVVAQVVGEVGQYNGQAPAQGHSIRRAARAARSTGASCFRPSATSPPTGTRSIAGASEIRGPRLRRTLDLFYDDEDFRGRYEQCPASTAGHHAELGGLLRHTCEVAAIGRAIAKVCRADRGSRASPARCSTTSASSRHTAGRARSRPPSAAPCSAT